MDSKEEFAEVYKLKPVLLLPTYNGWSRNRQAVVNFSRAIPNAPIIEVASSCLGHCFNLGYQMARRFYSKGELTHVIMLHADVVPAHGTWALQLLQEAERVQASVMSVVLPIKSPDGVTSTAIETQETQEKRGWHPVRFTMQDIAKMPQTFTHPRLMVNTGLMAIDMRQEWAHELVFDIESKVDLPNFRPFFLPEDWKMSRFAQLKGASLWATTKIKAAHVGEGPFYNDRPWGGVETEGALKIYYESLLVQTILEKQGTEDAQH